MLAPLFHRYLDMDKTKNLAICNNDYDAYMVLSKESRLEIQWWIDNVRLVNGNPIRHEEKTKYIQTDASLQGWGAVFGKNKTQGRWNSDESVQHINVLELKAIYFALKSLCEDQSQIQICVYTDSAVAVSYINSRGGSVSTLHEIVKNIWLWCVKREIFIFAVHIPGKSNETPDNLSRIFNDSSEWMLKTSIFDKICDQFFRPEVDLFASRLNHQLKNYVSWFPDPEAVATDAFSFSWRNLMPYIFSPFSLIPRILTKIENDQVKFALIIIPLWQTQLWFPKLMESLIKIPIKLPFCRDLLTLPHDHSLHPMNKRKLFLTACVISGDTYLRKVFRQSLPILSQNHGDLQLTSNMSTPGESGVFGVLQGKLIPLHQM